MPAAQLAEEKASRQDSLSRKVDQFELHRVAEQKADIRHVREALQQKADRTAVDALKASQAVSTEVAGHIALLKEDLAGKASIKVKVPTTTHPCCASPCKPSPASSAFVGACRWRSTIVCILIQISIVAYGLK
jgi:hypothetical protein